MSNTNNNNEYCSCNIIEHGFDAQIDSINLCCRISKEKLTNKLVLIPNYDGREIIWENFFQITDKLREYQKSGKTIPECEGCIYLENKNWNNEHYISTININNWIKCNAFCIYCDRKFYRNKKEYKLYPLIKSLIENNYLRMPADITIAGGEPTLTSDFDKILKIFIKNKIKPVRVLTNAIKYNKNIEKGLKEGLVNILVSVDSGTRETYKKIKQTDKHDKVWENIKKYTKIQKDNSLVQTKYIIIPNYNDNKKEIYEFINRNKESNVKSCCIDVEIGIFCRYSNSNQFIKRMYELFEYAKDEAKNTDITVSPFDRMQIVINKLENI